MSISSRGSISFLRPLSGSSRHYTMPLRAKITNSQFAAAKKNMSTQSSGQVEEEPDVIFQQSMGNRTILLNRPKKLNSLNLSMIQKILPRLKTWENSDLAKTIIMKGAGEKAFCAGGDVAALVTLETPEHLLQAARENYFRHEYTLDYYLSTYEKPMIAVMDGITMGGGVGLSINAPFRVATEKTIFAMPETLIGFFPDVGATYFLPRLDGELGIYLGLTGHQLKAYDTVWAGLATHYIPSERLAQLESRLGEVNSDDFEKVNATLEEFENGPPKGYEFTISEQVQDAIDRIFAFHEMASIMRNLEEESNSNNPATSTWAKSTIDTLLQRSPTSLHVSLAAMRATIDKTRYHTFQREFELASHFMRQPDFVHGVKARLIHRTAPTWSLPASSLSQSPDWVRENIIEKGRYNEPLQQSFYMLEEGKRDLVTQERGLFKWSLPMEGTVLGHLMRGRVDAGTDGFTRKEFVEYLVGERLGKAGFERKLNYILDKRTMLNEEGNLIWKFDQSERVEEI